MTQDRMDTIDRSFKPVKNLERANTLLFWISVAISFGVLFSQKYLVIKNGLDVIYVTITVLYFVGTQVLSLLELPRAQRNRSTHMIAEALGTPLDSEETQNYYNNSQNPSMVRLGMIIFENSLFSCRIASRMLVARRVWTGGYLLVWLLLLLVKDVSPDFIYVVAQTLFASNIISDHLRLEKSRFEFNVIFRRCWDLFLQNKLPQDSNSTGIILDLAIQYQSTLSSMNVTLSSTIFHKINAEVSAEWEKIKQRLSLT
ncbi:MAG: hypothetical protein OWT27_09875 [Firmicutes bacterium]|nr:hypothetical protein [Bacillota bacterium]